MKKILITGGNGYIAKSLAKAFCTEYEVHTITRQDFDLTNYLATNQYFHDKYFNVVVHTAVVGGSRLVADGPDVLDKNLQMYYNLLAQRDHYDKFIHFGSGAEIHMLDGFYGKSKRIISDSMIEKDGFFNIKIFGVFDENELPTRFIKASIINYIQKKSIVIHQNKRMTFFYMKDLITLVKHHIDTSSTSLMSTSYCSYIDDLSLLSIAEYINQLNDYSVDLLVGHAPSTDYIAGYNAGYGLSYVGLKQGIKEVYDNILHQYSSE
jgi:hypothetical protein